MHSTSKQMTLVSTFLISAEKREKIGINLGLFRVCVCVHSQVIIFPGSAEQRGSGLCVYSIRLIRRVQS